VVSSPAAAGKAGDTRRRPSAAATAGQPFLSQPVNLEEDQYGNLETGDNSSVVTAPLQAAVSDRCWGQATAPSRAVSRRSQNLGMTRLRPSPQFTGDGLTSLTSTPTRCQALRPQQASDQTQPVFDGDGRSSLRDPASPLTFEDQFNNVETGDNSTSVTVSLRSGAGPLLGTTTGHSAGGADVATLRHVADTTAEPITLNLLRRRP